jgi:regulation of enolase protein 1 (concanavalin A-like superfamily)
MHSLIRTMLLGLFVLVPGGTGSSAPLPKPAAPTELFDTFDGKLALDWKVLRPDPTHVSLKKVPGSLVITTQQGSIHGKEKDDALSQGRLAKNIHLVDIPFSKEADWVATTCVNGFVPDTTYQQAGLIVYTDDDNYFKWAYEFNWRKGDGQTFHVVAETEGDPVHDQPEKSESGLKRYWLRLTKKGDRYEYSWSSDGKKWTEAGVKAWGDGQPRRVGLIAKNGGNKDAKELDAAFEFFELRLLSAAPRK